MSSGDHCFDCGKWVTPGYPFAHECLKPRKPLTTKDLGDIVEGRKPLKDEICRLEKATVEQTQTINVLERALSLAVADADRNPDLVYHYINQASAHLGVPMPLVDRGE